MSFASDNTILSGLLGVLAAMVGGLHHPAAADFQKEIQPQLRQYCLDCHSTAKHKGDLDLERFQSRQDILREPRIWQAVVEQLTLAEMPPKDKPQPTATQKARLLDWGNSVLDDLSRGRAGDPGPVVLRRLSNAEYTYTIRDATGVDSLSPAKEFPTDSASGEGFMNVGNSLVMSPSMITKYLDAGKEIANHAVLLPDGFRFSPSTSQRDWAEERLAAIRSFYSRYTETGAGSAVNLQGIKFDTKDGGVIPLSRYLSTTITAREALRSGRATIPDIARQNGLNPKYLGLLWDGLNRRHPSLILDSIRGEWRHAKVSDVDTLVASIHRWQGALWRFTQVGHIGKRDGPKAWQLPVTPLASNLEVRIKIPTPPDAKSVSLFLVTSDAGDGNGNDFAVWENPRLVTPGQPDLLVQDVGAAFEVLQKHRGEAFSTAARCLAAAAEAGSIPNPEAVTQLALKHNLDPVVLSAWLDCLGIGTGKAGIDSPLTEKLGSVQNYGFVNGWSGSNALGVLANSSDEAVRIPGNMKPHSVAVHPSPTRAVAVGWQSPIAASLVIEGSIQHAHPECGNGVTWAVEIRRGNSRQRLANGTAQGAKSVHFGPFKNAAVQPGDIVSVVVGARDGNHACDLTSLDLQLTGGSRTWDLAKEVSTDILAGNPHADSAGHAGVWHFYSEPDTGAAAVTTFPANSLLTRWMSAPDLSEKSRLAGELQQLLIRGASDRGKDDPDTTLHRQLTSLKGPLLGSILRKHATSMRTRIPNPAAASHEAWGLDPSVFGRHPRGTGTVGTSSICVRAPSVLEIRLPAELVDGCEFVTTGALHPDSVAEGSVQMQVLTNRPSGKPGLAASGPREQGGKSTWSDGDRPVVSDSPILVGDRSAARKRMENAFDEFRQLFPAALCYTKIVPVDEVVTLTLYYREDDPLRRLMLSDAQAAELDRLWSELHYVSQDALKLVDAFEQLWQYATQDADPSAFTPMREPIRERAEAFRKSLLDSQPAHIEALLRFAERAYRRPLAPQEAEDLRMLYRKLRSQELNHEQAIRMALARVLVAPAFLYRAETPGPGQKPAPVDDWALATRLSYFLWASAPDPALRAAAASGQLGRAPVLSTQTHRMLADPKVRRLATEFACAWLHVYDFDELAEKSEKQFPTFTGLRGAMYEETIRFFTDLFQHDGSVLNILDADYAILNSDLANHYGIKGVSFTNTNEWKRVDKVKGFGRGGILAQATTLAKQSGASRTSPILRGNWLCEVLLGEKLPKPPKDVPRLPEDEATENLTIRALTERHTADPKCYGCHRRIDPYGYSLEAFDAIGRLRDRDLGGRSIDTHAKVLDGAEFEGLDGLRQYLLTTRREAFVRQFCRKLLGYALGRSVMLSDRPLLAEMQSRLQTHGYRVSAAVDSIVRSKQFLEIRGEQMVAGE